MYNVPAGTHKWETWAGYTARDRRRIRTATDEHGSEKDGAEFKSRSLSFSDPCFLRVHPWLPYFFFYFFGCVSTNRYVARLRCIVVYESSFPACASPNCNL